jgi:hypothetical protein
MRDTEHMRIEINGRYSQHTAQTEATLRQSPKLGSPVGARSDSIVLHPTAGAHAQERAKPTSAAAATPGGSRSAHLDPRVLLVRSSGPLKANPHFLCESPSGFHWVWIFAA